MANKNNKIEEIAPSDDDPTAELEALTANNFDDAPELTDAECEADAKTFDIDEFKVRNAKQESVSRLHYDIEQLHAKWLGLESEISAREEQTDNLNRQIAELEETAKRRETLLTKRESTLRELEADIRDRDDEQRRLATEVEELQRALRERETSTAEALSQFDHSIRDLSRVELLQRLQGAESHADNIRQQFQDLLDQHAGNEREFAKLREQAEQSREAEEAAERELLTAQTATSDLQSQLSASDDRHAEEILQIGQDLEATQSKLAEMSAANDRLTADLTAVSDARQKVEETLQAAEQRASEQIAELESQLAATDKQHAGQLQQLRDELDTAETQVASASAANDQLSADLAAMGDARQEIEETLQAAEKGASEQVAELESQLGKQSADAEQLESGAGVEDGSLR